MSKWKCGICGSEFENYYAQGFDDIIYCPLCYFKEIYKREQKKTKLLQNQLQQKENIIKEVREILKFHLSNPSGTKNGWHIDIWNSEDISKLNEDLGILDKENK